MAESARAREDLLAVFEAAIAAVNGRACVARHLARHAPAGPVYLVAFGKAACAMARGAHEALGPAIRDALVVTKRGYAEGLPWPVIEAGHPMPDEASLDAGRRLGEFIDAIPVEATVLVLLSGGGSALVEDLPAGMTLADLRRLNQWLLGSGLDIHAMNTVRKRLSRVKGGRLAQRLYPRAVLCLAISDVQGDDPRSIASGPLTPEPLREFEPRMLPEFARPLLAQAPPLPVPDDPCFSLVRYHTIASLDQARRAAASAAAQRGLKAVVHADFVDGEAAAAGRRLAGQLLGSPPGVLHVWGGETTVRLPANSGRGGRCQSLALAAATVLAGHGGALLLAAGTDGSDGPTEDAGALVDGGTLARGTAHGLDAEKALAVADAGTFLEASGDLVHTGATGTNVMDLMLGIGVSS